MKKIAILILSILIAGLFVACEQDITVDAQTYANMEVGTFVLNGQNYATLQAAVDAIGSKAAGDNVIKLTRNASGPGAKIASKDVTIDFQGYTYSFTNVNGLQGQDVTGKDFGLSITTGSDVVLKGLQKIDLNDKTTTDLTMVYVEGATTSLTIEDAPKMEVANSQYVFWAANGATLTIGSEDKTMEATITGKVAATGGTTEASKPSITVQGATSITGALEASKANIAIEGNSKIKASVTASDYTTIVVTSKDNIITTLDKTGDSRVVISEDITVQEVAEGSDNEIETVGDATVLDDQGEESTDVHPEEKQYIASIGTRLYEKLAQAITSAESGETILLLRDYDMEANEPGYGWSTNYNNVNTSLRDNCIDFIKNDVTFDLNNHEITNLFNNTFRIKADNITIRNGELSVGSLYLYMYSGGTWSSIPEGEGRICSYILYADEGTNLVIDKLTTYGGINIASGGLATINNLSFSGTKFYAVCSQSGSTVVLNDGTYDKVTGVTTSYLFWIKTGSGMIINNGTFLSRDGSINNFVSGASPVIYGGKFNFDPSTYVAEGYVARKTGDVWTVSEAKEVEVTIGTEKTIMSLVDFAKKVNDNVDGYSTASVKLLKNVDLAGVTWTPIGTSAHPFSGTFDGNNKTISNLKSSTDTTSFGLFNYVAGSTIIKDFTVFANIKSTANNSNVAAIYAHCDDANANVIVEGITVNGSITGTKYVAGLIAQHDKGTLTIIGCTNNADITCSGNQYAAGILGRSSEFTIGKLSFIDITNTGAINAGLGNAGGICSNLNHKYTEAVPISLGESKKWSEVVTGPSFEYTNCVNSGAITGTSGASQLFRDCSFTLTTAKGYAYYVPRILQAHYNNIGINIDYTDIDIYHILEGIAYATETAYVATAGDAHFTSIEDAIGFTNLSGGSGVDITLLTDITNISTVSQIKTNVDLHTHQLGGKLWISEGNITISNGSLSKLRATTKVTLENITFTGTSVGNSDDGHDLTIYDPNNLTIVSGIYSFNPTSYLAEGSSVSPQDDTWIVTNASN